MALIYLLLFVAPQVLVYGYLRERLPDPTRPGRARFVRVGLAVVFIAFNFPWLFVARRVLFGSVWGRGRVPYLGPWLAWQMLGWIFAGLVAVYIVGKSLVWLTRQVRVAWSVAFPAVQRSAEENRSLPRTTHDAQLSRRRFLARATYAYAAAGAALSTYGIWNAERLPEVTRRTLTFPDLPPGLDGLRLLHLSDVHAGIHMEQDKMQALVGIDDPRNWRADDPRPHDIELALRRAPPEAFQVLLAHRPGAFDGAAPRGIPLTLAGHIHGGQLYLPVIGWSVGRLITKYVMGHFRQGNSQLYVSRGIGVVGVPIRVFVPPEIALIELRRSPPTLPRSPAARRDGDRKSTRLNSSHLVISYAVFCLKK